MRPYLSLVCDDASFPPHQRRREIWDVGAILSLSKQRLSFLGGSAVSFSLSWISRSSSVLAIVGAPSALNNRTISVPSGDSIQFDLIHPTAVRRGRPRKTAVSRSNPHKKTSDSILIFWASVTERDMILPHVPRLGVSVFWSDKLLSILSRSSRGASAVTCWSRKTILLAWAWFF